MKKEPELDFGKLWAPEDSATVNTPDLGLQDANDINDAGVNYGVWEYHNENKIHGVPVCSNDCNLKIDNNDLLQRAFELRRLPKLLLTYLQPDETKGSKEYTDVLNLVYEGKAMIVEERTDFDIQHGRYVLMLRYDELQYMLHPRYYYLREE